MLDENFRKNEIEKEKGGLCVSVKKNTDKDKMRGTKKKKTKK